MMKVIFAINFVSSFMFMDIQSGYLLIGLKDNKQTISNPRTIVQNGTYNLATTSQMTINPRIDTLKSTSTKKLMARASKRSPITPINTASKCLTNKSKTSNTTKSKESTNEDETSIISTSKISTNEVETPVVTTSKDSINIGTTTVKSKSTSSIKDDAKTSTKIIPTDKINTTRNVQNGSNQTTQTNQNDTSDYVKPIFQNESDPSGAWPTYGFSIILPSPMFGQFLQPMRYKINKFMSKGQVSDKKMQQTEKDLHQLKTAAESWIFRNYKFLKNPPIVFQASPIAASFDIHSLLAGVRNKYFSLQDKARFMDIIQSTVNTRMFTKDVMYPISGNTVIMNYPNISKNVEKYKDDFVAKENVTKILDSISSGVPDAIYLASSGLNLGRSPILGNRTVFIVQSPKMVERQVENCFARALSIQMGSFPIEMKRVYEGMVDSITALVKSKGQKKKVLIGIKSSRTDTKVYQDIINLAHELKVTPKFPKDIELLEVKKNMMNKAYHLDIALLTLPDNKVCVGHGIFTKKSILKLERLFSEVHMIPKKEWMKFALNSILIDERLGFTSKFFIKAPRLAITPPSTPTLEYVLMTNGYEVITQNMAYDKGGASLRSLALFANVENHKFTHVRNTRREYGQLVSILDRKLSNSIRQTLHWTTEIHELTAKIYELKNEFGVMYY